MVKGFSIASLVLGILSLPLCCTIWLALLMAVVGLILGIISLSHVSAYHGPDQSVCRGMAIAGIVCSSIGLSIVLICLTFAAGAGGFSDFYNTCSRSLDDVFQDLSYSVSL